MTQDRYSRQILFNKIGEKGQEDLRQAQVLIVGMGVRYARRRASACRSKAINDS